MSRRRFLLASVIFLCLFWYFLLWITAPAPGINQQGFQRLKRGMTLPDVIGTLGATPGDYITGKPSVELYTLSSHFPQRFSVDDFRRNCEANKLTIKGLEEWLGNEGIITIHFDGDGRVDWSMFNRVIQPEESLLAMLRRWLRL
jgi:hypothetical protein